MSDYSFFDKPDLIRKFVEDGGDLFMGRSLKSVRKDDVSNATNEFRRNFTNYYGDFDIGGATHFINPVVGLRAIGEHYLLTEFSFDMTSTCRRSDKWSGHDVYFQLDLFDDRGGHIERCTDFASLERVCGSHTMRIGKEWRSKSAYPIEYADTSVLHLWAWGRVHWC